MWIVPPQRSRRWPKRRRRSGRSLRGLRRRRLALLEAAKHADLARLQHPDALGVFADIVGAVQDPDKAVETQIAADALKVVHQQAPVAHLQGQELAVVGGRGADDISF